MWSSLMHPRCPWSPMQPSSAAMWTARFSLCARTTPPADAVRGAVKKLQDAGVRVLGSVLTRYDMKKALKGSSYAYSYAYNYNYAYENQKANAAE